MADQKRVLLADATIQQIQLELIRRSSFNEFDGPKIAASLERHRALGLAAIMDWFCMFVGLHRFDRAGWFPSMSLTKLRGVARGYWNVDTLVVLTENVENARRLAAIAEEEQWEADEVTVHEDEEELGRALDIWPCPCRAMSAWWD
jgi:hypothetical protein